MLVKYIGGEFGGNCMDKWGLFKVGGVYVVLWNVHVWVGCCIWFNC